tara:strand:- start:180 stop:554 length:375 start_codon:yes stop_codon:yes gene_type:complete
MNVKKLVNKVYPIIAKDYSCNAEVELYGDIYERLNGTLAISDHESYAEYSWSHNKIYLYTNHLSSEEDIIRSLIHECVHSNQCYELYEALYECDLDYDTHPYEIEAEYEEENWKKYKLNTIHIG